MKTKSYRLNITPRHAEGWEIFAEVRKVVPPKVKIEDGGISINGQNATPGKYQLEVKNSGHKAIIINVEVIPEEKD